MTTLSFAFTTAERSQRTPQMIPFSQLQDMRRLTSDAAMYAFDHGGRTDGPEIRGGERSDLSNPLRWHPATL